MLSKEATDKYIDEFSNLRVCKIRKRNGFSYLEYKLCDGISWINIDSDMARIAFEVSFSSDRIEIDLDAETFYTIHYDTLKAVFLTENTGQIPSSLKYIKTDLINRKSIAESNGVTVKSLAHIETPKKVFQVDETLR